MAAPETSSLSSCLWEMHAEDRELSHLLPKTYFQMNVQKDWERDAEGVLQECMMVNKTRTRGGGL